MNPEGPVCNTRSKTSHQCQTTTYTEPSNTPPFKDTVKLNLTSQDITPKSLTADQQEALLQVQKTDPFGKCISKRLSNGKAPKHDLIY